MNDRRLGSLIQSKSWKIFGRTKALIGRWLLNQKSIPDYILIPSLETLFSRPASMIAGSLLVWIVAGAALARTGQAWALIWLMVDAAILVARISISRSHQRGHRADTSRAVERRAFAIMGLGLIWAVALGSGCFLCVRSQDPLLALLSSVLVTAVMGGGMLRNAAASRHTILQMALFAVPFCVGVLTLPLSWTWLVVLEIFLFAVAMSGVASDQLQLLTKTLLAEHAAKASAARLDAALINMPVGLMMFEAEVGLQVWNDRAAKILGTDPHMFVRGMNLASVLQAAAIKPESGAALDFDAVVRRLQSDFGELQVRLPDGRSLLLMGRRSEGGLVSVMVKDITRRRQEEERVSYLARHDALTGLANRTQFNDRIAACYAAVHETPFTLLFIDLDGFKAVNDSYGHQTGDQLLCEVAARLTRHVPPGSTVARLGGDEFAILLPLNSVGAVLVAEHLVEAISHPFEFGPGRTAIVGASIGLAQGAPDGMTAEQLQSQADRALYAAKAAGKGVVRMFDSTIDRRKADQSEIRLRATGTGG